MDDEDGDVRRCRRPQPTQLAPEFPTRLVGELHVRLPHRYERFLMSGRQSSADFLFEIRHRAQQKRYAEKGLGDFLDTTFTDALGAREVRKCRRQTRADAVGANLGRDRGLSDFAAARTGTGMGLVLDDLSRDLRQLGRLKTLR